MIHEAYMRVFDHESEQSPVSVTKYNNNEMKQEKLRKRH